MDWSNIVDRCKKSVLQIICHHAEYNITAPYAPPTEKISKGSGFIIDISRGLIVTNAHVVDNPLSIIARSLLTGKENLNLLLVGICRDRDLAICRLTDESKILLIKGKIGHPPSLNMRFGDDLRLQETEEVMTIGYPLGEEQIKFTTGVVSGFHCKPIGLGECQSKYGIQEPSYIQITAPLNPGNSGGPLVK